MDVYVSQLGNKLVISGQELHGVTQMDLRGYGTHGTMCEMCVNIGYQTNPLMIKLGMQCTAETRVSADGRQPA